MIEKYANRELYVSVKLMHGLCRLISGDINFVDYEMSEFRDEITDIAAMICHRNMQEIVGEKTAPIRGLLLTSFISGLPW